MAIRMGRWDCPVCGLKGNRGPDTHCVGCGSPRGKEVIFYLPEDAEEVTDADKLQQAKAGADWRCDYCGADNKATNIACQACGNERNQEDIARSEKVIYNHDISEQQPPPTYTNPADNKARDRRKYRLVVWSFVLFTVVALWYIFKPRPFEVEVVGHEWERTVEIEQHLPFVEEDWQLPANARLISQRQDVHHYNQVLVGYQKKTRTVRIQTGTKQVKCGKKDLGNGYFEDVYCNKPVYENRTETYEEPVYKQVPVFQTKYKYEIYRWTLDHTAKASGADKQPVFPQETLPNNNWREGKRGETYTLILQDKDGKQYREQVTFEFWQQKNKGDRLQAKHNALGGFYGLSEKGK
ncbi:MAG: zinc finger Ran-binding domain-containing protein [Cytophagales bacterium]|nr:zinc finger Ran-binding domain-containing protein [Bernardetiaceae bacterium]MDW8205473.1 zinc finger Ran-binding domain-containing protein [Cytophagales bacterium]